MTKNMKLVCDAYQIFPEKGLEAVAHMVSRICCCEDCPHLSDCNVATDREDDDCKNELIKFMEEE